MPLPFLAAAAVARRAFPVVRALAGRLGGAAASPAGTIALGAGAAYAGTAMAQRGNEPAVAAAARRASGGFGGRRRKKRMTANNWGNVYLAQKVLGRSSPGMMMVGMRVAQRVL